MTLLVLLCKGVQKGKIEKLMRSLFAYGVTFFKFPTFNNNRHRPPGPLNEAGHSQRCKVNSKRI